jgi:hypothetical protein
MKNKQIHPSAKSLALGLVAAAALAAGNSAQAAVVLTFDPVTATFTSTTANSLVDIANAQSSLGISLDGFFTSVPFEQRIDADSSTLISTLNIFQKLDTAEANFSGGGTNDLNLWGSGGNNRLTFATTSRAFTGGLTISGLNAFSAQLPALGTTGDIYVGDPTNPGSVIGQWQVVPEPSTFALLGLAGLGLLRRRR